MQDTGKLANFTAMLRLVPRGRLIGLLALMLLAALTDGIGILLLVPLLTDFGASGAGSGLIATLGAWGLPRGLEARLILFVVLIGMRAWLMFRLSMLRSELQHDLTDSLRQNCYAALVGADWRWLAQQRAADHNAALLTNSSAAGVGLDQAIGLLSTGLTTLAMLSVSLLLSWQTTLLAVVCGLAMLVAFKGFRRRSLRAGADIGKAQRGLHRHVDRGLAQLREAKIFGIEATHNAAFAAATGSIRASKLGYQRDTALAVALTQPGAALLIAAVAYAGLRWAALPLAELLPLLLVLGRTLPLIERAQQGWSQWLHTLPAVAEIRGLTGEALAHAEPATASGAPPQLEQAIVLAGVTVQHAGRDQAALRNVSVTIPARTTVAITGPSGAGKSTLADLLAGLISPDAGTLAIDSVTIAPAARSLWRSQVAYVQQDPALSHGSIRDNLCWVKPDASQDELEAALRAASAEFALDLPDGLDTVVGDAGLRLSGGERQRIALARALLRKPTLLILDEATSALDAANEAAILAAVARMHGQLTVVIIGHRPAMLEHADQVIELADGRLRA
jgi:ATP-binding cassette subfamily C protein